MIHGIWLMRYGIDGSYSAIDVLPEDFRALIVALLGAGNLVTPDEPKLADPHCDEAWRPHEIPAWAQLAQPFVLAQADDDAD